MPNQLAATKRRQSLADHQAALAALAGIADREGTTVAALLREALRAVVRERAADARCRERLYPLVMAFVPRPPERFATPAVLARFKRSQREFDQLLLDLGLADPETIQARNSLVSTRVRVLELEQTHVSPA